MKKRYIILAVIVLLFFIGITVRNTLYAFEKTHGENTAWLYSHAFKLDH